MSKQIGEFNVCDFGIEHSQYFQGIGTSHTDYDDCAYGIGDNPSEALDDLLENLASSGYDVDTLEARILADMRVTAMPTTPSVSDDLADDPEWQDDDGEADLDGCELHYHFGLQFKVIDVADGIGPYDVVVGNVGTVYSGDDEQAARKEYDEYVEHSKTSRGRASGESVTLLARGDIIAEYIGPNDSVDDPDGPDNLDCMDVSDLHDYCQSEGNPAKLREYAACKARAVQSRLDGNINRAVEWENVCQRLYDALPLRLRW